jgi:hypothetical protein
MLGRSERESGAHAKLAAQVAGWASRTSDGLSAASEDLLDLGSMTATLSTVASIDDLAAVVHIGHPAQPSHDLERALLAAARTLVVTSAVAVPAQWAWVSRSAEADGNVVVDEAAMRDSRHVLRSMGASPRLVPTRTSVEERIALAGPAGTLVVERSRIPAGYAELPGSSRLGEEAPIWYGLVEPRNETPAFDEPAQVWLAFGPRDDHRGSLQETLTVIADAGIDMQHLRSHRSQAGPHIFFSSFSCPDRAALARLIGEFDERGVAHRVLAVMPGQEFVPGPDALYPQWATRSVDA